MLLEGILWLVILGRPGVHRPVFTEMKRIECNATKMIPDKKEFCITHGGGRILLRDKDGKIIEHYGHFTISGYDK